MGSNVLLGVLWLMLAGQLFPSTIVYQVNKVVLPVVVSRNSGPMDEAAARELARVLGVMSGLSWPVLTEADDTVEGIYVGDTHMARRAGAPFRVARDLFRPGPGEVGPDAFRIRFRGKSVVVEAATPEATRFAVSWMLQSWMGARWFAAGRLGETVPRLTSLAFPSKDIERQPGYLSREIYGLDGAMGSEWAVRNGLASRLEFGHALSGVFPRPLLEAFPHWQPELFGQRYLPTDEKDFHWQPNLADPGLAEVAAHRAARAFESDPNRRSFSLGINDSVRYDQSPATRELVEPLRYFRGMPDYSPLVFTFMNRAAAALGTGHPGRSLGCLAYFWCENTPPFQVDRRVMPYLTTDRGQYYDAAYRRDDLELMSRWANSGAGGFGLWEYAYGQGFIVPRVPHRLLADAIHEGWKRGARGYFAEVGPHPGYDAFKVWMIARLLWQPDLSFESLADEFFDGYYGKAAEPMRAFFDQAEEQWVKQPGPPYWIKYYQHEDQALLFPPNAVARMRSLLDRAAVLAAADPVVAARIAQTMRAFELTEAFLAFDGLRRELSQSGATRAGASPVSAEALSGKLAAFLVQRDRVKAAYERARLGPDPAIAPVELEHFTRNDPVPRLLWEAAQKSAGGARKLLQEAGGRAERETMWTALAAALASAETRPWTLVSKNSHFAHLEDTAHEPRFLYSRFGPVPAEWILRSAPTESGRVAVVDVRGPEADKRLRIEGAWDTQVFQWHRIVDGDAYVALARVRGRVSPGNDSGLFLTFLGGDNRPVGIHRMQSLPKGQTEAEQLLVLADRVPPGAVWVGVGVAASRQVEGDWLEVDSVELNAVGRNQE